MRNLKKVLAVVLALAMAFSLVASAAYTDVTTGTPVAEAVDLLSGLSIVGGYPDGSFGPEKDITRAEFAKMLFITITGGDNADLYAGDSGKYSDVKGDQWFASYVNWATQLNILGGYPDGTMKPDNNITIAEATKMLIVALGFEVGDYTFPFGFIDKANQLKMFKNVSGIKADAAATRGQIAQMTYNTLFVTSAPRFAEYIGGNSTTNGWVYKTPIEAVFGAAKGETEIVATSTNMPGLVNNLNKAGLINLKGAAADAKKGTVAVTAGNYTFNGVDELVGHKVVIWFLQDETQTGDKKLDSDKFDKIIAVTDATETTVMATAASITTASGQVDDMKQGDAYTTIDGVNIPLFLAVRDLGNNAKVDGNGDTMRYFWNDGVNNAKNWVLNGGAADPAFKEVPRSYNQNAVPFTASISAAYNFVDNDVLDDKNNDRKVDSWDHVYINYWKGGKVSAVNTSNITVPGINGGAAIPMEQIKGGLSGIAKDDYVNVTATTGIVNGVVKDIYTIKKAEVLKNVQVTARTNRGFKIADKDYTLSFFKMSDCPAYAAVKLGTDYDVVLDNAGYIMNMVASETALPSYMLVKDVAYNNNGLAGTTFTVTGLLSDGSTKTYQIDTNTTNGLKEAKDGATFFFKNPYVVGNEALTTGWTNKAGTGIAIPTDIGAIGKLVQFKVNADGKIFEMNAVTSQPVTYVDGTTKNFKFKFDAANNVIYKKTELGSYQMDKLTTAATLFFSWDDNGSASNYTDDKFTVTTADKMASFENTDFAAYTLVKDEALKVEAVLLTTDLGKVAGDSNVLAIPTYENSYSYVDKDTMKFGMKVVYNGKADWVWSVPINVSAANGDAAQQKSIICTELFGRGYPAGAKDAIYLELDNNGAMTKCYVRNYQAQVYTIESPVKSITNNNSTMTKYRAAVLDVNGTTITLGKVNAYGKATLASAPVVTTIMDENGQLVNVTKTLYSFDTKAMFPVAADANITFVKAQPSGVGAYSTATVGTLDTLSRSSDGGISYVIDFVLREKGNVPGNPLEISQIIAFTDGVGNFDEVKNLTVAESRARTIMGVDALVPASGSGTAAAPFILANKTVPYADASVDVADVVKVAAASTVTLGNTAATATNTTLTLNAGNNDVFVKVVAEDGVTTTFYKLVVAKTAQIAQKGNLAVNATVANLNAGITITAADIFANLNTTADFHGTEVVVTKTGSTDIAAVQGTGASTGANATIARVSGNITAKTTAGAVEGNTYTFPVTVYVNGSAAAEGTCDMTIVVTVIA